MVFKFSLRQFRTIKMIPIGASVTANAILIVFREDFVTVYTIFIYTILASPWFVWVFLVQFGGVVI